MGKRIQVFALLAVVTLVAACEKPPRSSATGDSGAAVSARTVSSAKVGPTPGAAQAASDEQMRTPRAGSIPMRHPDSVTRRVDNPCGGVHVIVIVRPGALGGASDMASVERTLREVANDMLAPFSSSVISGTLQLSPAIRTFRVTARDRASAASMILRLRSAQQVETAEMDQCNARVQ